MTHAIMFHHFHNDFHKPSQGSLSASDFNLIVGWLRERYNILDAQEYIDRFLSNNLKNEDICLTFDDGLKCQYDVAVPILAKHKIKAFFFVDSSSLTDNPNFLEIFRYFRTSQFKNVDEFYSCFFEHLIDSYQDKYFSYKKQYSSRDYLSAFPFYTENDKWFRYLRDQCLNHEEFTNVMFELISSRNFDIIKAKNELLLQEDDLLKISNKGHTIGLHSYSHPTQMSKLNSLEQLREYQLNFNHLSELLKNSEIISMSHPCGDYNLHTLNILKGMGIKIGFRSNMSIKEIRSPLEIPREDHSNIFKMIQ